MLESCEAKVVKVLVSLVNNSSINEFHVLLVRHELKQFLADEGSMLSCDRINIVVETSNVL